WVKLNKPRTTATPSSAAVAQINACALPALMPWSITARRICGLSRLAALTSTRLSSAHTAISQYGRRYTSARRNDFIVLLGGTLLLLVFGFSARSAEKPNTANGSTMLPQAESALPQVQTVPNAGHHAP